MTVIAFPPKPPQADGSWRAGELKAMVEALAPALSGGESARYDIGLTEIGDPQFYLLGPPPHDECILCISRLGRTYVLEDGAGQVLYEHNSLVVLADKGLYRLQRAEPPCGGERRRSLPVPRCSGARLGRLSKRSWRRSWVRARSCSRMSRRSSRRSHRARPVTFPGTPVAPGR